MHQVRHHKNAKADVYRITGARMGLSEDVSGRQRRYVITMLIRTLCFVVAVILFQVLPSGPGVVIAFGLIVASLLMPYFAVVIANAGREPHSTLPTTALVTAVRPALEPGTPPTGTASEERGAGRTWISPDFDETSGEKENFSES